MRTNPSQDNLVDALKTKIESPEITAMIESINANSSDEVIAEDQSKVVNYTGPKDDNLLAVIHPINIGGIPFSIIAEEKESDVFAPIKTLAIVNGILVVITVFIILIVTLPFIRRIVKPVTVLASVVSKVAAGDLNQKIEHEVEYEIGGLSDDFNTLIRVLKTNEVISKRNIWLQEGVSDLNEFIRGQEDLALLSRNIISFVCQKIDAQVGAFYLVEDETIRLTGSYAFKVRKDFVNTFSIGEGVVGQAVLEQQILVLAKVPNDYFSVSSGLGNTIPKVLSVIPIIWEEQVVAVLEMGSLTSFTDDQEALLNTLVSTIAVAINSTLSRDKTKDLLERTQTQAEALAAREVELSDNNKMLENQTVELANSRSVLEENNQQLQAQQEELRTANEELESKARELEESGSILEEKNNALDLAKHDIEQKAEDLALSSQYKSEFLANMSHELRTPLNSLLILSKLLADNKKGNLEDKQVEYASTIHDSGTDLLNLINDILDLSKIEAGRMDIHVEQVNLREFSHSLERKLKPLAEKKNISFEVTVSDDVPKVIQSDGHKLAQVIKNLISNAMKFTSDGGVSLTIESVPESQSLRNDMKAADVISIHVKDTGIGIPEDKQKAIFEAFQQADGTTERKYGGTGLGLSISRELAKILGGYLAVESEVGVGSDFFVILPKSLTPDLEVSPAIIDSTESTNTVAEKMTTAEKPPVSKAPLLNTEAEIRDDRLELIEGDRSILIIEDDGRFAKILQAEAAERGFKVLMAEDGETGLYLADYYKPSGIILDIGLPGLDGNQVIARLKDNLKTRHIPVHFMSGHDVSIDAFKTGAIGYLTKPVSMEAMDNAFAKIEHVIDREMKSLLVIEDNETQLLAIRELIGEGVDVDITTAVTGAEALSLLQDHIFDCVVLDLGLPDMTGAELLEKMHSDERIAQVPIIVYTGKDLEPQEKALLDKYAQRTIIKSVRSPEKLLDDTALFLHRVEEKLPEDRKEMIRMLHDNESVLAGRKAIVVDDDMRNVFALSNVLQDKELEVIIAKNGLEALSVLDENKDADIVLMDIMMPEMNGYEAMRRIREQDCFKDIPIIALTAKAMKGDRAECIKAGASDYLSKPVDTDKLLSMMRVWLYR